jgi:hypothetical protein
MGAFTADLDGDDGQLIVLASTRSVAGALAAVCNTGRTDFRFSEISLDGGGKSTL